jgi:hypothetical protein
MLSKREIVEAIRKTAEANDGKPPGIERFARVTGIRKTDWYGKFWARWEDALVEAGYPPNKLQERLDPAAVVEAVASLANRLGRFPVNGDFRLEARRNPGFPAHSTIAEHLGDRASRLRKVLEFCDSRPEYANV